MADSLQELDKLIEHLGLKEGPDGELVMPSKKDLVSKGRNITIREAANLKLHSTGLKINPFYNKHPHASQLREAFPEVDRQMVKGGSISNPSPSVSALRGNITATVNKLDQVNALQEKGYSLDSRLVDIGGDPDAVKAIATQKKASVSKQTGKKVQQKGTSAGKWLASTAGQANWDLQVYDGEGLGKGNLELAISSEGGTQQSRGTKKWLSFPDDPKDVFGPLMETIKDMPDEVARNAAILRTVIPFRGAHEVFDIQVYDPSKWDSLDDFLEHTKTYKKEIVPYYRMDQPGIINIVTEGVTRGKKTISPKRITPFLNNLIQDQIAVNATSGSKGHSLFPNLTSTIFSNNLIKAGFKEKFKHLEEHIGRPITPSDFRKIAPSAMLAVAQQKGYFTGAEISKMLSHEGTEEIIEGMKKVTAANYAAGVSVDEVAPQRWIERDMAQAAGLKSVNQISNHVGSTSVENTKNTIPMPTDEDIVKPAGQVINIRAANSNEINKSQELQDSAGTSRDNQRQLNQGDKEIRYYNTLEDHKKTIVTDTDKWLENKAAWELKNPDEPYPITRPGQAQPKTPIAVQTDKLLGSTGEPAPEAKPVIERTTDAEYKAQGFTDQEISSMRQAEGLENFAERADIEVQARQRIRAEKSSGSVNKLKEFMKNNPKTVKGLAVGLPFVGGLLGAADVHATEKKEKAEYEAKGEEVPAWLTVGRQIQKGEELFSPIPTTHDVELLAKGIKKQAKVNLPKTQKYFATPQSEKRSLSSGFPAGKEIAAMKQRLRQPDIEVDESGFEAEYEGFIPTR